ncbi:MAG: DoxX family protein [Verrucomicrobiaceae bacterium]|nr:DoxX family protein [Verrucomicrobiaceae bacterium]
MALNSFLTSWSGKLLSLLRIISAGLMMQHGGQKVLGFPAPSKMEFVLFSQIGVAGVLELVGGFLLLIGLFTRPVAFLLSGLMAVAYFIGHASGGFWPMLNGGELAVLYCFVYLYLAAAGGGDWSADRLLSKKRG